MNRGGAKTQKGQKEKSVKICLIRPIREPIFLNTNGEWNLAKRTKRERGKKRNLELGEEGRFLNLKGAKMRRSTKNNTSENLFNKFNL